jgi:hypothetical protein
LIFGTFAAITTFSVLSHDGVYTELGYFSWLGYSGFLCSCFGIVFRFLSALIAIAKNAYSTTAIAFFWFCLFFFLNSGSPVLVTLFLCIGMALMGFTYGPLGTFLSELFPTNIRYSGNFFGI